MVISKEHRTLIKVLHQSTLDYEIWELATRASPLKNAWRQPLDGATDRGVVRLGSRHLCGSESVAYSSASLRL